MKLKLPEGFQMPASAKPGEPFEVVATLVAGEEGVMLTALDGVKLPEEQEEDEEEDYAEPEVKIPFEGPAPAPAASPMA